MGALVPLITALLSGGSFSAITLTEWIGIASALATAAPKVKEAYSALHPAFNAIIAALERSETVTAAGTAAHNFCARNADAAIRLQPDGD